MASISVNIDISGSRFVRKLPDDELKDKVLRQTSLSIIELMTKRIHEDGLRADGTAIGKYSESYMEGARKKNNRAGDRVIFVLTGDLQTSWNAIETEKGYGIGFIKENVSTLVNLYRTDADLLAKFGRVFELSESEKEKSVEIIKDLYLQELRKT